MILCLFLIVQELLDICESWANENRMSFNTSKSCVLVLNGPSTDVTLKLSNDKPQIVQSYKYLGVTITAKRITNLFKTHFSLMLEKTSTRAARIRGYGFHIDGLRLSTAVRLYKLLVRPILEYCAQILTYARYYQQASPNTSTGFANANAKDPN